jgi:hypothetical protein
MTFMPRSRLLLFIVALAALLGVGAPGSASAQVFKPTGLTIPGFFFPAAERRARAACADELPTCRASVRAQMEQEMAISLVIPWIILGVGVLIVLVYLRKQERQKQKARDLARRHHDPGAFRKLDKEKTPQKTADEDDDAEQLS